MALPANVDSMEFSVMTDRPYVGAPLLGYYTNEQWGYAQSWMMLDIQALQTMYGADYSTNAGNTTYTWSPTTGQTFVEAAIPGELLASATVARAELIEACAELDDALLEKFVGGRAGEISAEEIERALRAGVCARRVVVVLCGSAHKNKGIQQLLDAVCAYLPSPLDAAKAHARELAGGGEIDLGPEEGGPLAALAFKVTSLDRVGSVTLLRIYAGRIRAGALDYGGQARWVRHLDFATFDRGRLAQQRRLVLLSTRGEHCHHRINFRADDVLMLGRESCGVPEPVFAAAEVRVRIPMRPGLRSLNVTLAAAVVLGEALRQTGGFA